MFGVSLNDERMNVQPDVVRCSEKNQYHHDVWKSQPTESYWNRYSTYLQDILLVDLMWWKVPTKR